ncbi:MAG: hypothetical protein IPM36_17275 [Lewinellaceae bacterium]|nr:hypothetical protein [Lewinellaceae bacterium]
MAEQASRQYISEYPTLNPSALANEFGISSVTPNLISLLPDSYLTSAKKLIYKITA